jgi:predicted nucleic acid-binding protein
MVIYFDTCCYNRPYDDQVHDKVRAESEAVKNIIKLAQWYGYTIFSSKTLETEIGRISDLRKYKDVLGFYRRTVTDRAYLKKNIFEQIAPMALQAGMRGLDVFHLCFSISAAADYLVTTDDGFLKAASKMKLPIKVINPVNFPLGGVI